MPDKDTGANADKGGGQEGGAQQDKDLNDLLQELRVLLQGSQVLTAFLTILPFNQGFDKISNEEKWIFLFTFLSSLASLILFSAPAALHRIARPVRDKERLKDISSRLMVIGLAPASLALVLSSQIVTSAVIGEPGSWIVAGLVAAGIGGLWWLMPLTQRNRI